MNPSPGPTSISLALSGQRRGEASIPQVLRATAFELWWTGFAVNL